MDDFVNVEVNGRNLKISSQVLEKLLSIKAVTQKQGLDTSFWDKLVMIAAYFRQSPEYVLMYLEPILEMVKNNIHPGTAFVLFDEYLRIELLAKMDAEESVRKRKAQNKRWAAAQKKRELFKKIKQEWDVEKTQNGGKSLKELLMASFPEESEDARTFRNLCQQYHTAIREEVGVEEEMIKDEEWVIDEFLNSYMLDHAGIAEQQKGTWRYFKIREKFGKARSRIDRILNRKKYERKFKEYWEKQPTQKKSNP